MIKLAAAPALVLLALTLAACSSGAGETDATHSAQPVAASPSATPTQEPPVTVNIDVSGVTAEQAATCTAFGADEGIQRSLGNSKLAYVDSSSIQFATSGFACTWENTNSASISIRRGDFHSAAAAAKRLSQLRTTLPDAEDIAVNGSDQAYSDAKFNVPVALAQFGPETIQVTILSLSADVDGSIPGDILSKIKH